MSTLLLDLRANRLLNQTMFQHHLLIYDNLMVFRKRGLIRVHEVSISYNHVSQVYLSRGLFFGTLEIINTGGVENIIIKYVSRKDGEKAKRIIDKKIYSAHSKNKPAEIKVETIGNFEQTLSRMKELLQRGKISKKEFERKRLKLLGDIK